MSNSSNNANTNNLSATSTVHTVRNNVSAKAGTNSSNDTRSSNGALSALNPLALAHVLEFLPLAQHTLDQQVDRRADPRLMEQLETDSRTRVMLVCGEFVAIPLQEMAQVQFQEAKLRLATLPYSYVQELTHNPHIHPIFLGVDKTDSADRHVPYVAFDVTEVFAIHRVDAQPGVSLRATLQLKDNVTQSALPAQNSPSQYALLTAIAQKYAWVSLKQFAPRTSACDAGMATTAVSVAAWHALEQYCPRCGSRLSIVHAGWVHQCEHCSSESSDSRDQHQQLFFPRIEPAVITSIIDAQQRILLQHNTAWRENFYSVSAGFVEAGENLEHAARREALEETGIELGNLQYLGSQPWPFSSSLMVAFAGVARNTDIYVDGKETQFARWFTRDELLHEVIAGNVVLPGKAAIARYMIEQWYGSSLPDC